MDGFKTAVLSVCTAAMIGAAFRLLCPSDGVQKAFRAAVAAFILCTAVCSFRSLDLRSIRVSAERLFDGQSYTDGTDMAEVFRRQVSEQTETRVALLIDGALANEGFAPEDIFVKTNGAESDRIELEQITVRMKKDARPREAELKMCVKRLTGVSPEVYYVD